MATMNISLPDELKMRMDRDQRNLSWSAVARKAFELELKSTMETGGDMNAVVERLRASKQKAEEEQRPEWIEKGRQWVQDEAEYEDLVRVVELATAGSPNAYSTRESLLEALCTAANDDGKPSYSELLEFSEQMFGMKRPPSIEQIGWFLDGVLEIWNEVENRI